MGKRYSSKWKPDILTDYCWKLVREIPTEEIKANKMSL
jgi:hypothetical protein